MTVPNLLLISFILAAVFGLGLGGLLDDKPRTRFGFLIFFLGLSVLPLYPSYQGCSQEVRGWYEDVEERFSKEKRSQLKASLRAYQWTILIGGAVTFLVALIVTNVHPALSAFFPGVVFVLHSGIAVGTLRQNLPQDVILDNMSTIWLGALCAIMQAFLIGYVWKGWKLKEQLEDVKRWARKVGLKDE